MRLFTRWAMAMSLLLIIGQSHAEAFPSHSRMVLMTENFPPFNMSADGKNFSRDANITGSNTAVIREMFKRAGIPYHLSLRFPWDRMYNLVLEKDNYALFSVTLNDTRKPDFQWVGPLSSTRRVFVAAPGSTLTLTRLEEAHNYRIGSYRNASSGAFLEKNGIPFSSSLRDQENISKLLDGRIDFWVTNDPVFHYYAAQQGVSGLRVAFVAEAETYQYLAINRNTPEAITKRLQESLDEMSADGTLQRLQTSFLKSAQ